MNLVDMKEEFKKNGLGFKGNAKDFEAFLKEMLKGKVNAESN